MHPNSLKESRKTSGNSRSAAIRSAKNGSRTAKAASFPPATLTTTKKSRRPPGNHPHHARNRRNHPRLAVALIAPHHPPVFHTFPQVPVLANFPPSCHLLRWRFFRHGKRTQRGGQGNARRSGRPRGGNPNLRYGD